MRLRSLEIQGFKSFPDKTRLDFNDGITAVVGPNGSGKSNIADAMRWVLGEQSSKTLRGGKMEDVIFGGTQLRKAQGFAQVQLTIDNRDRALACDSDEVSLLRKLYRSGESEYRLNGASVRLRDIYELLMDTGLGRDGYSIIGQGRISEIVSAKSTQRREIFEEAAGISKYRYRKAEAERRLADAQENLLRLKDILQELEERVGPLRVQAEKAKQFLEYSGEKKILEVSLWMETLERSKALIRAQSDKILLCRTQYEEIEAQLDATEKEIGVKGEEIRRLAVEMDGDSAKIRSLEEQSAEYARQIAVMENDMAHNNSTIERLQAELAQSGISGEELEAKIHSQQTDIDSKKQEIQDLEGKKKEIQGQIASLTAEKNACTSRIDGLKERRYGLTQSINGAKLSNASSTSLIDETIQRLEALREESIIKDENLHRLDQEVRDCTELLETIREKLDSLQNTKAGHTLKLQGRQEKLASLQGQHKDLEDEARQRRQRAKLLSDMENSMEGFQNSVKFVMNKASSGAISGIFGPVSRLVSAEDQYALAIEIALGAAMQNIVVENETVAKRAIGMLKEARSGRCTFLPLTTVKGKQLVEPWLSEAEGFIGIAAKLVRFDPKFSGIIDQLLGRIVIVQDLDCATMIAKQGSYRFRVVTLDGQVVNTGGSMTGGYAARSAGILSRAGEIERLQKEASALEKQMAGLDKKISMAQSDVSEAQAVLSGVDGELASAQEDRIRYEAELRQLKTTHAEAVRLKDQSAGEYTRLSDRLEELKAQNISSDSLIAGMEKELAEVANSLLTENETRQELTEKSQAFSDQMAEYNMASMALGRDVDGMRRMLEQLKGQQADQTQHRQDLENQIRDCEEKNKESTAHIAEAAQAKETGTAEIKVLEEGMTKKRAQRDQHEAEAAALRAGQREVIAKREGMGRELARLEEKKAAMSTEYDQIIARLWEEYEITPSKAAEIAQPIEDDALAHRKLAELKTKIRSLGSVNTDAVEEYQQVSARYLALKEQTDDVEHARTELLRLITQLTDEMRTIFLGSFDQISKNFSAIFKELFGGGKGNLTLTNSEDVLESGVEIHVQPPGKLIGSLAALSGGEQALVAIAIYFAILKVRPSPFVLLDEIEAALDDVNVVKYAQYLRKICDRTQFIAITHRRGTMEEADMLYGVTMQEEGISKLLALDVNELESKLGMKQR